MDFGCLSALDSELDPELAVFHRAPSSWNLIPGEVWTTGIAPRLQGSRRGGEESMEAEGSRQYHIIHTITCTCVEVQAHCSLWDTFKYTRSRAKHLKHIISATPPSWVLRLQHGLSGCLTVGRGRTSAGRTAPRTQQASQRNETHRDVTEKGGSRDPAEGQVGSGGSTGTVPVWEDRDGLYPRGNAPIATHHPLKRSQAVNFMLNVI